MSNTIVVGAQWGDEGKGKIVDFLTEDAEIVVRAQGGNNAGHTVITGDKKYVLHLMPSGILWKGKTCVIGNGVVLDPASLVEEIDKLLAVGIEVSPKNLRISDAAHLTMPYHCSIDQAKEASLGESKIGTTGRGIGPTYSDKIERSGLRTAELRNPVRLAEKLAEKLEENNLLLEAAGQPTLDVEAESAAVLKAAERLEPFLTNTPAFLHDAIEEKREILFEGAQGTYLDIDHGTYPYVTSSNTTAGGACTGSGVPPTAIDRVVAVTKAYTTRVGEGPFTTENDEIGEAFHKLGREFGATTGRARRCGWFDAVMVRHAVRLNGATEIALTILDGLDTMPTIKICTSYKIGDETTSVPPATAEDLERAEPIYEEHPGWNSDTTACKSRAELPPEAQSYLARIEELTGANVSMIGVGPDREQTLVG